MFMFWIVKIKTTKKPTKHLILVVFVLSVVIFLSSRLINLMWKITWMWKKQHVTSRKCANTNYCSEARPRWQSSPIKSTNDITTVCCNSCISKQLWRSRLCVCSIQVRYLSYWVVLLQICETLVRYGKARGTKPPTSHAAFTTEVGGWFAAFKHHGKLGQLQSGEVNTVQRLLRHVIIFSIYPNTSSFLLEEIMRLHSMYLHRVLFEKQTIGIMKYQINLNSSL